MKLEFFVFEFIFFLIFTAITRDSGSKIVFNDMPLYFPCPCRSHNPKVAQLMRVHIVTPKAPVNISIDPRVRNGKKLFCFFEQETDFSYILVYHRFELATRKRVTSLQQAKINHRN